MYEYVIYAVPYKYYSFKPKNLNICLPCPFGCEICENDEITEEVDLTDYD